MSKDYFQLGGGMGLKLSRMMGVSGATIVSKDVCAFVWVSVHETCVKGKSVWALFYWKCHALTGTGVLFFCRDILWGVINKL